MVTVSLGQFERKLPSAYISACGSRELNALASGRPHESVDGMVMNGWMVG